jgi:hypothetical protein
LEGKFGDYVTYQSNEYKAIRTGDRIEILSENPEDQFKGFIKYSDNVYTKSLDLNKITAANRVKTIAQYKGRKFLLVGSSNDKLLLITSSLNLDDQQLIDWGFKQVNKGEYQLENIRLHQLDKVWEEREPIWQDIIKNKKDLWKF